MIDDQKNFLVSSFSQIYYKLIDVITRRCSVSKITHERRMYAYHFNKK